MTSCAAALHPLGGQLQRDMQHWPLRSITPAMLKPLHESAWIRPGIRASLLIVNNTVYYTKLPLGAQHPNPMWIALLADLHELTLYYPLPDVELVINFDDCALAPPISRPTLTSLRVILADSVLGRSVGQAAAGFGPTARGRACAQSSAWRA